jgi:hypothetical protein
VADSVTGTTGGAIAARRVLKLPTLQFWLVINLRAAGALGLQIPSMTLLRADRAIE